MPTRRREPLAREEPAELQVAATNGSIVTDARGKKYIDFVMGWCVGNFGWRHAAIAKAIERQGIGEEEQIGNGVLKADGDKCRNGK